MLRRFIAFVTAFVAAVGAVGTVSAAAPVARYNFTDLGVLPGAMSSFAWAVNDQGQTTGYSGAKISHGFLWTPSTGSMQDLGTLPGDVGSIGNGINGAGIVVGASVSPDVVARAFVDNGTMTYIGSLGGADSQARAINAGGEVAGFSKVKSGMDYAFLWIPDKPNGIKGHMFNLGAPSGATGSSAVAINSAGAITGWFLDANYYAHGFIWTPRSPNDSAGTMTPIPEGTGVFSTSPNGINASNAVVGGMTFAPDVPIQHAFLYDTSMHDLGTLGGSVSVAYGINDRGVVVGTAETAKSGDHAFVYADGSMVDLNRLLPAATRNSGVVLAVATAISANGQIVGAATVGTESHAFLLTPA